MDEDQVYIVTVRATIDFEIELDAVTKDGAEEYGLMCADEFFVSYYDGQPMTEKIRFEVMDVKHVGPDAEVK